MTAKCTESEPCEHLIDCKNSVMDDIATIREDIQVMRNEIKVLQEIHSDVKEILEMFITFKEFFKVIGWAGKLVLFISAVMASAAALNYYYGL